MPRSKCDMQKIWSFKDPNPQTQRELSDGLKIHPIVAQLLINRNITDRKEAEQFLCADLSHLHDPFLIKDMEKAVARIRHAQKNKENVLIHGDYDVDGVTSSAMLYELLTAMGINVLTHIPHRMDDGYGLNHGIAKIAKAQGVGLLIAVDCGITAYDEVEAIKNEGIDVIIIDHHEPAHKRIPKALAIINPKQNDCNYPFRDLASVGLVAKLTQAMTGTIDPEILHMAALGTITDVAPLRGENRIFVKAGLPTISQTKNIGLQALMEVARIDGKKKISPYHVGFILGPRINAAGRMDTAHTSLDLLLAKDPIKALALAKALERHNNARQKTQREIVQQALEMIDQEINFNNEKVIVLSREGWHKGVLGIVASKIAERYYRPAVVISLEEGIGTASARSIEGFHLHDALANCSDWLEQFGGHEGAAGLTIKEENIDPFRRGINKLADRLLELKKLTPVLAIDCEIPLNTVNMELAQIVESMEPFGEANPAPIFCSRKLDVVGYPRIMGRDTLKFWVTDGQTSISAVGFGMADEADLIRQGKPIDLAYELAIDDWNKAPETQLKLKDIRLSE